MKPILTLNYLKNNLTKVILLILLSWGFQLFPQSISIISPNGDEQWEANSTQTIEWESENISEVKIEYSLNRGMTWHEIISSAGASLGQYPWTIPNVQISEVLIRISDASNSSISIFDESDKTFSIFIKQEANKSQSIDKNTEATNGTAIKIMPLGDSITEGTGDDPQESAYRSRLFDLLESAGYIFDFVGDQSSGTSYTTNPNFDPNHEGIGGMEVGPPAYLNRPTMQGNIETYLGLNLPDIVLFHMGTNDLNYEGTSTGVAYEVAGQLKDIIINHILIHNPNAVTFLARIIHNNHFSESNLNSSIDTMYTNLTTNQKKKIKIVDMHSSPPLIYPDDFSDVGSGFGDLHPIESGYNKMADKWFSAMQNYFKPPLAGGTSPVNGASSQPVNLTITWNQPPAASDMTVTYHLQVSEFSNFSTIAYQQTGISGNSNSPTGIKYGQTYYWRVGIDNLGWSETWSFTTQPLLVDVTVLLQGPYNSGSMNTNLRSLLSFPLSQPYNTLPWNYNGSESVGSVPVDVVDWVLVELHTGPSAELATTVAATRAGFILNNGKIVDIDGSSFLNFSGILENNYYIAVYHRNHLAVMSNTSYSTSTIVHNFTIGSGQFHGGTSGAVNIQESGVWGMVAGDGNGNGQVQNNDSETIWKPDNGTSGYKNADFNLNGQVQNNDNESYWKPNNGRGTQVPNI